MTAPRPGDAFHLDLGGTVIAGRYIEVDPPHRLVIGWDRHGTDKSTPTLALVLNQAQSWSVTGTAVQDRMVLCGFWLVVKEMGLAV
jgi:uncharacterized protein YndB with AHSA1/START domain